MAGRQECRSRIASRYTTIRRAKRNRQRAAPVLHMLSVLTAVLTGAILVRLGLERSLLGETPHRACGQRPSSAARGGMASPTRESAS